LRGWSLAELAMVIAICAILGVGALMLFRPRDTQAQQLAERLRDDLRHAQILAITWVQPLRMTVASTTTYNVACVTASAVAPCNATPVIDPATGQAFTVSIAAPSATHPLQSGFTMTGPGFNLDFDALGRPRNAGALIAANASFTISGGSANRSVVVAPITGLVAVQ
jgi:Tfp pilus assembly protein FimT